MKNTNKIILASKSPRRKSLLKEANYDFKVKTIDFEEVINPDIDAIKMAEHLAIEKNKAHREAIKNAIILTADTVVIFNDQVIGKPKNEEDAHKILKLLSGKVHQVITGICISSPEKIISKSVTTDVKFRNLTDAEILCYIENQPPLDKAGSYGIQDWIGLVGVEWIKGCYNNVVGLPVNELYELLSSEFDIYPKNLTNEV